MAPGTRKRVKQKVRHERRVPYGTPRRPGGTGRVCGQGRGSRTNKNAYTDSTRPFIEVVSQCGGGRNPVKQSFTVVARGARKKT